ncbi:Ribonuclease VapC11 [Aquisphaera giovannonii]|uniref:Ribonuclease VapC n=1 Tax=Aquisphaera giovannonii TaxID=406548 RepID=A0A5B9WBD1_9BACT|nr:PIN domain nuclease [Aquisphaera giovannonii]QEH37564.1 Ribonuclease VapC11 [Aquisphaera giovannonii]
MILVDSSVWIDYFRGTPAPHVQKLDSLIAVAPLAMGDLVLAEVLQGCTSDKAFNEARRTLSILPLISLCGPDVAVAAARNFRTLRSLGVTVRKTIDAIIATRCIVDDLELLHNDRDFEPFQKHLGLRCVPY